MSNMSVDTRSSSFSSGRRRGYIRPQGLTFAESAKNRDSVMSLGSIAHLQYYFARTGLLDGKGGQMAKKKDNGQYDIPRFALSEAELAASPIEEESQLLSEASKVEGEDVMLPPTVSTYGQRLPNVTPLPDQKSLKKELLDALESALQALESCGQKDPVSPEVRTHSFYELEGLHILDTTTLAIRAARLYYTMHPNPKRLNQIKPESQIRHELYGVLEVLKKIAARNFVGGIHEDERLAILVWVSDIGVLIDEEARLADQERQERRGWHWMDTNLWDGRVLQREMNFLRFLQQQFIDGRPASPKPEYQDPSTLFRELADGRQLVQMHNAAVDRSKKRFGHIGFFHQEVTKPYRRAENLRFWLKAAELRWELKLKLEVMVFVNAAEDSPVWTSFEDAVLQWSRYVRAELTEDWHSEEDRKLHARAKSIAWASPRGSPSKKADRTTIT